MSLNFRQHSSGTTDLIICTHKDMRMDGQIIPGVSKLTLSPEAQAPNDSSQPFVRTSTCRASLDPNEPTININYVVYSVQSVLFPCSKL